MNKKLTTIFIIGLLGLPMAAAATTLENHGVITGHTTYANMSGFDPNIAAIAGLAESKVVWFNGQTIFSTTGEGYVFAVPAGTPCTPMEGEAFRFMHANNEGYSLSYKDPNNISHIVGHYTYQCPQSVFGDPVEAATRQAGLDATRHHTWVTLTHAKKLDGPLMIQGNTACGAICDSGRIYNFALAVDTSYWRDTSDDGDTYHEPGGGRNTDEINNGDSYCEQEDDHVCNEGNLPGEDDGHEHNSAQVDLYFSKSDIKNAKIDGTNTTHPGTYQGCTLDAYCSAVLASTYADPTATSP